MNKLSHILIVITSISGLIHLETDFTDCSSTKTNSSMLTSEYLDTIPKTKTSKLFIKDSTQYSTLFLNDVRYYFNRLSGQINYLSITADTVSYSVEIKTRNDSTITYSMTTFLPTNLPLNTVVEFSTRDSAIYSLHLKRINLSDIEYEYFINDISQKKGKAILEAGSFLGFGAHGGYDENGIGTSFDSYLDEEIVKDSNKTYDHWFEICLKYRTGSCVMLATPRYGMIKILKRE